MILLNILDKVSIKHLLILNLVSILVFVGVFGTVIYPRGAGQNNSILAKAESIINPNSKTNDDEAQPTKERGESKLAAAPEPTPVPKPDPLGIAIPSINLDAPVIQVSFVKETKEIEVPKNAGDVGWYKYSPAPGINGSTIMSGHYDTPTGAPAVFFNLANVKVGDVFQITNVLSKEITYKVKAVRNLPLVGFPKELIFGDRDYSQVTLMTCAGVFDPVAKLYSHRLAVIGVMEGERAVELPADTGEGIGQYVVEGFIEEQGDRVASLGGAYLRLQADQEKISVYLATNGQDVIAAETVFQFDPTYLTFNPDLVAFHNGFEAYYAHQPSDNTFSVSVFTDPARSNLSPFNTQNQEIKVADIFFTRQSHGQPTTSILPIFDANAQSTSKILMYQQGSEIHSSPNILNSVEGTQIVL